jgi:hyperosmotically inducible periplasmic protein
MKKMMFYVVAGALAITTMQSCKKKMSDADMTKAATEALVAKNMTSTTVAVKDGVATLGGICVDDKCKADCEAIVKSIKGGDKLSIVNNCTVTPPQPLPVSVTTTITDAVQKKIGDGLKDFPNVKVSFSGNKAVFTGEASAKQKNSILQLCNMSNVPGDLTNVKTK